MSSFHIAQINIARALAPIDSPTMADFVARLDELNALAEEAPGFVWRLKAEGGMPSSYLQPYDDERIVVNMSVWESVEQLKDYVYKTAHAEVLRARKQWFEEHLANAYLAAWWVPAGHIPGIDEAKKRLAYLDEHGPSQFAFTFKTLQPPDESWLSSFDWSIFRPCPAT